MRTLIIALLLCISLSGRSQVDTTLNTGELISFYQEFYTMGEFQDVTNKTTTINITKRDSIVLYLSTGSKTSAWILQYTKEVYNDENEVYVDYYVTKDERGTSVTVKMYYEEGNLTDIAFLRMPYSYHFYLSYLSHL